MWVDICCGSDEKDMGTIFVGMGMGMVMKLCGDWWR